MGGYSRPGHPDFLEAEFKLWSISLIADLSQSTEIVFSPRLNRSALGADNFYFGDYKYWREAVDARNITL